jgi:hypothetical protein
MLWPTAMELMHEWCQVWGCIPSFINFQNKTPVISSIVIPLPTVPIGRCAKTTADGSTPVNGVVFHDAVDIVS